VDQSSAPHWPAPDDSLALARGRRAFRESVPGGVDLYYPLIEADGTTTVLRLSIPNGDLEHGVARAWFALGLIGIALIATAAAVADRIAASISRPLQATSTVAHRLASGEMDARADDEDGAPEVRAVSAALNVLAERITSLLQAERESLADLSHQLRTPLTALRLHVEQLEPGEEQAKITAALTRVEEAVSR
jgi:signal transduction histidine kinase